jgi:sugar lactone lactonase YvrE
MTTLAGTGAPGYAGDGGPAVAAALDHPSSVAVDSAGNVYIADEQNVRIRRVDKDGTISTYAGGGEPPNCCSQNPIGDGGPAVNAIIGGVSSIAVDAKSNLYIVDKGNSRLRKVDSTGVITTIAGNGQNAYSGDGGPAVNASLLGINIVSVTPDGNIYVSGIGRPQQTRKIDSQG